MWRLKHSDITFQVHAIARNFPASAGKHAVVINMYKSCEVKDSSVSSKCIEVNGPEKFPKKYHITIKNYKE